MKRLVFIFKLTDMTFTGKNWTCFLYQRDSGIINYLFGNSSLKCNLYFSRC
jgi:hypothetical protein